MCPWGSACGWWLPVQSGGLLSWGCVWGTCLCQAGIPGSPQGGHLEVTACLSFLQMLQNLLASVLPGPGPAAVAEQQEGAGWGFRGGGRQQVHQPACPHLPLLFQQAGMGSTSVLSHEVLSCLCGHPRRAGLCRCSPLLAGWGAAGNQAISSLFMQLLGSEGGSAHSVDKPCLAVQCGGRISVHLRGMLQE